MNNETAFECSESIHRGGPCLACGGEWDGPRGDRYLRHMAGCTYLAHLASLPEVPRLRIVE